MKEVIAGYLRTAQSRSRPNDPARDVFCKMRGRRTPGQTAPGGGQKDRIGVQRNQ